MNKQNPALITLAALLPTFPADLRTRIERAMLPAEDRADDLADRVLSPAAAARALACSTKTIHRLARAGHLHRVVLPGRKLGHGVLASSVARIIGGGK